MKCGLVIGVLLSVSILLFAGCDADDEDVDMDFDGSIEIGVIGPMEELQGRQHWSGALLAKEEINEAGGVQVGEERYKIELKEYDSKETVDPAHAKEVAEEASRELDYLVGGFRTEAVREMTEVAVENETVFMICGAADDDLLAGRVDKDYETWKYLFRVSPIRSSYLAKTSMLHLGHVVEIFREEYDIDEPRVAILREDLDWNEDLALMVQQHIETPVEEGGLGAQWVGTEAPSAAATDITRELENIEFEEPHVIYTAVSGPLGEVYGQNYKELEIPAASVGILVEAQSSDFIDKTGGDYIATVDFYGPVEITPQTMDFYESFENRFGEKPIYNAGTYDAVHIIKEAIEETGDAQDMDSVVEAISRVESEAAIGNIDFDETHDLKWGPEGVTGVGIQWQGGEVKGFWPYEWQPDPEEQPELEITYEGAVPYKIAPWVDEYWR